MKLNPHVIQKAYLLVLILFIFFWHLTSCSNQQDLQQTGNRIIASPSTPKNRSTEIIQSLSLTPDVKLRQECPTIIESGESSFFMKGSILFGNGPILDEYQVYVVITRPGIWAISTNNFSPQLLYEHANSISVTEDGTKLVNVIVNEDDDTLEAVIYDLETRQEISFSDPYNSFTFMELLFGQAQVISAVERIENVGEKVNIISLNPSNQSVLEVVKMINLPEFAFNDSEIERWGMFYGYEAIDPTGQLILYSAKGNDSAFEIRLLDLNTGEILWQNPSKYLSSSIPQWSQDGNHVIFDVSVPIGDTRDSWWKIISLNSDGHTNELPPQPYPFIENGELVQYSLSPDRRYIFYVAWDADFDSGRNETRAFIVDSWTGIVGEICDTEAKFVAAVPSRDNIEGQWLADGQFVYRTVIEKEGNKTHSLRILDIPSWTVQVLFEPEAGEGVTIYGWTPIEFP